MAITTDELVRIAAAGWGFNIDASIRETDELVKIASAPSNYGSRIHILNTSSKATDDLVAIAAAGKG